MKNWIPLLFMSIFQTLEKSQQKEEYPGSVRGWKNRAMGPFEPVGLGQNLIGIRSSKIQNTRGPNPFVNLFWTKIQRDIFSKEWSSLALLFTFILFNISSVFSLLPFKVFFIRPIFFVFCHFFLFLFLSILHRHSSQTKLSSSGFS